MLQPKSYSHAPAPDDGTEDNQLPDISEQLEAWKAIVAEAEDLCAEFAIDMCLEAQRAKRKAELLSRELGESQHHDGLSI